MAVAPELTVEQTEALTDLKVAFDNFAEAFGQAQSVGIDPQPYLMGMLRTMMGPQDMADAPPMVRMLFGGS